MKHNIVINDSYVEIEIRNGFFYMSITDRDIKSDPYVISFDMKMFQHRLLCGFLPYDLSKYPVIYSVLEQLSQCCLEYINMTDESGFYEEDLYEYSDRASQYVAYLREIWDKISEAFPSGGDKNDSVNAWSYYVATLCESMRNEIDSGYITYNDEYSGLIDYSMSYDDIFCNTMVKYIPMLSDETKEILIDNKYTYVNRFLTESRKEFVERMKDYPKVIAEIDDLVEKIPLDWDCKVPIFEKKMETFFAQFSTKHDK